MFLSFFLVALLVICYFTIPEVESFFNEAWNIITSDDEIRIKKWVNGFGWLGPVVIVLAMVIQMFLIVVPSNLLMVVAILAYGPIWGSLITFTAVLVAASIGYFIGKYLGSSLIDSLVGGKTTKKVTSFLEDYGFWAVVITRINTFLSNDAVSFVAGILRD